MSCEMINQFEAINPAHCLYRLHLNIQVTGSPGVLKLLLLVVILLHLPDGVQEEEDQNSDLLNS